jgi:hypothetical protein
MGANLTNQQGIILRMLGGNIVTRYTIGNGPDQRTSPQFERVAGLIQPYRDQMMLQGVGKRER